VSRRRSPGKRSSAWIRPEKRWAIYERDGFRCVWCGQEPDQLTLDHLFHRRHRCRDNEARRLVTSCVHCNLSRKDLGVADTLRNIRAQGFDVEATLRRLRTARWVPVNRRAGARALAAARAREAQLVESMRGEVVW